MANPRVATTIMLAIALCVAVAPALSQPAADCVPVGGICVPVAPNNLVVFPNRDFVTVEGYAAYKGQTLRLEVQRGATVIGAAIGTVSGGPDAFEINHPGALCWGTGIPAGNELRSITPNILTGDKVVLKLTDVAGTVVGEAVAQDVAGDTKLDADGYTDVTGVWSVGTGASSNKLTLTGSVAAAIAPVDTEIVVVAPGMREPSFDAKAPNVLRRDIRVSITGAAKPNGLVTGGTSLTFAPAADGRRKWTATFTFMDPPAGRADGLKTGAELAALVLATGDPSMSVAQVDGTQALTIVEFLQGGGPAEAKCPPGPRVAAPGDGTFTVAADTPAAGQCKVSWTLPTATQANQAVRTGWEVSARAKAAAADGTKTQVSKYVVAPDATSTTLTVATVADYDFKVRSEITGETLSAPFAPAAGGNTGTLPPTTCTDPVVTETVNADTVTLKVAPLTDIYYTTDGVTPARATPTLSDRNANLYSAPIPIPAAGLQLSWVAFGGGDCSHFSPVHTITAAAAVPKVVKAPTPLPSSEGQLGNKLYCAWSNTDAAAVNFVVRAYKSVPQPTGNPLPTPTLTATVAASSVTFVNGIAPGDTYWFQVAGMSKEGQVGPFSAFGDSKALVMPDALAVGTNRFRAGKDWSVSGTSSAAPGVAIQLCTGNYCDAGGKLATATAIRTTAPGAAGAPSPWTVTIKPPPAGLQAPFTLYVSSNIGGRITAQTQNGRRLRQLL